MSDTGEQYGIRSRKRSTLARIVVCLVTYEALTDAMGGDLTQEEQNAWYKENQGFVDGVAAAMLKADPDVERSAPSYTHETNSLVRRI